MSEVTTTPTQSNEQGLAEFNKLKASIDEMAKNLLLIKVTDETSMAIANQQLSKAKQIDKDVDNRHALVKEEALRFCQAADLAKRTIKAPLAPATLHVETELLNYNRKVEAEKKAEIARLEAEQEALRKEADMAKEKLIAQMQDFESRAFKLINDAVTPADLSFVYTNYVLAFPAVYDVNIQERIKKLGKLKLNVVQTEGVVRLANINEYTSLYNEYMGTKQEIVVPTEVAMPSFDAIEIKKSVIENAPAPTNIKKTWKHEVVSIEAVPLGFLIVDEAKVKAFIKENSGQFTDGIILNGIKYYLEASVKVK